MHVCMYLLEYADMFDYAHVRVYPSACSPKDVCMYVCVYPLSFLRTYVCMHVYMYVCVSDSLFPKDVCMHACMYVRMHVCVYPSA